VTDTYHRLVDLLDRYGAAYRLIDHPPEGRTDAASKLRRHPLAQAAKSIILKIKIERYAVAVVPGDQRIDTDAVRDLYGAVHVGLATAEVAERLAGSPTGSIVPFSFLPDELELLVDPALLRHDELYFNAARLDRSLALRTDDYLEVAKPRIEKITNGRRR
jgi:Ala-tRNA(Pro) deacylase